MSTIQIVSLSVITAAFVVFALVLAWGDRYTRNLPRRGVTHPGADVVALKPAAQAKADQASADSKITHAA